MRFRFSQTKPLLADAPSREARLARIALVTIPLSALVLVLVTRLVLTSSAVTGQISAEIARTLGARARASVQLGGVRFGWDFAPCLDQLELQRQVGPLRVNIRAKEACIERWASAVGSGFRAVRVRLTEPRLELEGLPEAPKAQVNTVQTATKTESAATLREVELVFDDLRLAWSTMPVPARLASGSFGPIDGAIAVQSRGRQAAAIYAIREPTTGSSIHGRIDPTKEGWDLSAGIEGDMVPIFRPFLTALELELGKLPARGELGATYATKERKLTVDLDLQQTAVDVSSKVVSARRLSGFKAREKLRIELDLRRRALALQDGLIEVNGVPFTLSLNVAPAENSPRFDVRFDLRTTPLSRVLRSVPGATESSVPPGLSPAIMFAFSFSMAGQLRDPATWQPKLEHGLGAKTGAVTGFEFVRGPFEYYPLTKEGRSNEPRIVGPGMPSWTPYERIPYLFRRAAQVSEDASFFQHQGIELAEMQNALARSAETGERTRGGSTISQQLVKNLFLSRDRSAVRKVQEVLLTLHMESVLSKEQIFELYLNVIEWGPGIYGAREAALHYFGRPPERLTLLEMAYLASIIPGPILYHKHFEEGFVPPKHLAKIHALLERLQRLGSISEADLAAAKEAKIRFNRAYPARVEKVP